MARATRMLRAAAETLPPQRAIVAEAKAGDRILVMSNGGFGGIHAKLLAALTG